MRVFLIGATGCLHRCARSKGSGPGGAGSPCRLRDVTTILIDCTLRPEECFRLRWRNVRDNARRSVPLTPRASALLEMRRTGQRKDSVFPALTRTGHLEKTTLKKRHRKALKLAKVEAFTLYALRHSCLTSWAAHMDPCTPAYLDGRGDFATTKRYVHPHAETVRSAMERARGAKSGHSDEKTAEVTSTPTAISANDFRDINGRGERIRTSDLLVPNQALYQAEPRPDGALGPFNHSPRTGLPQPTHSENPRNSDLAV